MSELELTERQHGSGSLVERAALLIEEGRAATARHANLTLAVTFWRLGKLIDEEVLGSERAAYGEQIVVSLGRQLAERYGRSFTATNLRRMMQFAQVFPDEGIVVSLGRQLSWTHFRTPLPVRTEEARAFYIDQAVTARLSVRALRDLIGRQGFERKEIANAQTPGGSAVPADAFRDPYLLDFLGLGGAYAERDLEEAIVRGMEEFLLEVGNGWAFVARQKRMMVGGDDFYLDLLYCVPV